MKTPEELGIEYAMKYHSQNPLDSKSKPMDYFIAQAILSERQSVVGVKENAEERAGQIIDGLNETLHSHLYEIMPSVCEDSGQAEWSRGELQKMIDEFKRIVTPYIASALSHEGLGREKNGGGK